MSKPPSCPFELSAEDVVGPDPLKNPYPFIAKNRARGPVGHDSITGSYIAYSEGDVQRILRDRSLSRDPRQAAEGTTSHRLGENIRDLDASILFLDPPEHTRLRSLVSKAFTPHALDALRPRVQEITSELLDAVADADGFDVMEALAVPLPVRVIAEMLGVDPARQDDFKRWSDAAALSVNPFLSPDERGRVDQVREGLREYLDAAISERRHHPGEDLVSQLILAQEGDDRLTDREIAVTCSLLLVAGNVTTTDLIGNGVLALLEQPSELTALRAEPSLIDNAVEEMLRYDPPVVMTSRTPTVDYDVAGCRIPAGQTIVASLASANRDPASRTDPDRFDILRENVHHNAFGGGVHFCLGAHLARLEAAIAIGELVSRFPSLALDPDRAPERKMMPAFHGLESLPVRV